MAIEPYAIEILLGFGRLALAAAVLYGVACCLFPFRAAAWKNAPLSERQLARLLLAMALPTLLVQGLVTLRLYDDLMFAGCLLLAVIGALWWRHRNGGGRALYVHLLKWVDQGRSLRSVWSRARGRLLSLPSLIGGMLLGGLVAGSTLLRLAPHLSSPAPFSLVYYRLLEMTKHLQINQLFPGSLLEARGFHSLAVAFHSLSVADMGIVVRLLGVLAVLFILMGIYGTTYGYTGDAGAAFGAAGLFGFSLPLLPLAIENQVEPTPVLLATAYALPTWHLLLRYQTNGDSSYLWVGGTGLALLLLTEGSVAALMLSIIGGLSLMQSAWAPTPAHSRRALSVTGLSVGGGLLLGGLTALRHSLVTPDPFAVPTFSVEGTPLPFSPPDLPLSVYGILVGATALTLLVSSLTEQTPFRQLTSWALAVSCLGLYGLWHFLDSLPIDLHPMAPVALLSLFLAVGLGGLLARITALIRILLWHINPTPALRPLHLSFMSWLLLLSALVSPVPLAPTLKSSTEPDGYMRAFYQMQREASPYKWTVVSHRGTAVHAMNQGRFLTYDYFLQHYDAETYNHAADEAIPTPDLFLFVPTETAVSRIRAELLVSSTETTGPLQEWVEKYQQRTGRLPVFYKDEDLTVYRLTRSPRSARKTALFDPQFAQALSPSSSASPPASSSPSPRP